MLHRSYKENGQIKKKGWYSKRKNKNKISKQSRLMNRGKNG